MRADSVQSKKTALSIEENSSLYRRKPHSLYRRKQLSPSKKIAALSIEENSPLRRKQLLSPSKKTALSIEENSTSTMEPDMDPLTDEEAANHMQAFIRWHTDHVPSNNFDNAFNRAIKVRSATVRTPEQSAKAVFAFQIPKQYTNSPAGAQTTHGGAVATFLDMTTSMTMIATNLPGWITTGLTRRLDVTYLKPPVEGDHVVVESEVLSVGKRLATIRGVMRRERDGVMLAVCQHDKVMPSQGHYNL